jgi:CP family cyanate transporter-like MFS transporter
MNQESSKMPWVILGSACLLGFSMWAPMFCVPPMEHILKEELLLTHAQTSLLYTAPILMVIAVGIPAGYISDRIGVRKAAGIGVIIMALGAVLRGTATTSTSLLAFTFIYGVGLGWCYPMLPKLVCTWVQRDQAGVATGIYSAAMHVGLALAMALTMSVVFPITNTFQGVFFFWSIPPVVAAIVWWTMVKEPPACDAETELAGENKVPLRQILLNRNLWKITGLFLLEDFFFFTWSGWAPALMMLKGASASTAGLIASITAWVGIPTVLFMPRLAYKLGLRKPFLWGSSAILALAAWGAMRVSLQMSWPLMALVGFADLTRYVILLALPIEIMSKEEVGTASGLMLSVGSVGGIIGPLIGGHILDLTGSLDLSLLVLIGGSIAAVGIALRLPETGARVKKLQT